MKLCIIKAMYTEAINHDPAVTFFKQVPNNLEDPVRILVGAMVWAVKMKTPSLYVLYSSRGTWEDQMDRPLTPDYGNGLLHSFIGRQF